MGVEAHSNQAIKQMQIIVVYIASLVDEDLIIVLSRG